MLEHVRSWFASRFGSTQSETAEQRQDSARLKRESRAHTVTDLQTKVRHLQQQITDLTASNEAVSLESNRTKLAELERQLAETQAELARYQGRI